MSLPEMFKIRGYKTIANGKVFHNRDDHGLAAWSRPHYPQGEHNFWGKHNLLHGASHTPLMISRPGQEPIDIYTPVSLVDVAPTLLDLASIEKPDHFHGHSLVESLDGKLDGLEGITYSRWKSGDAVVSCRWIYAEYDNGEAMLLDMENDPKARRNAVNDRDKEDAVTVMKERLNQFRAQAEVLP